MRSQNRVVSGLRIRQSRPQGSPHSDSQNTRTTTRPCNSQRNQKNTPRSLRRREVPCRHAPSPHRQNASTAYAPEHAEQNVLFVCAEELLSSAAGHDERQQRFDEDQRRHGPVCQHRRHQREVNGTLDIVTLRCTTPPLCIYIGNTLRREETKSPADPKKKTRTRCVRHCVCGDVHPSPHPTPT